MNCKPGDLAIVVESGAIPRFLGYIVRVTAVVPDWPHDPHWDTNPSYFEGGMPVAFCDSSLRPIRSHGDDARDNAWDWLPPVPNDISAEDPQDLREALKQWAEEQR